MSDDCQVLEKQNGELQPFIRKGILTFEKALAAIPEAKFGDNDSCPLVHTFAGPIYIREIRIPKDTLLTGKIHRHDHPMFLLSGDASIVSEHTGPLRIKGPCHFVSQAGTKRLIYTHEECVFVTIHYVGEERDLSKIEDIVIAPTYEDYEKGLACSESKSLSAG